MDTHGSEVLRKVQTLLLHGVLVGQLVISMGCCQKWLYTFRCILFNLSRVLVELCQILVEKGPRRVVHRLGEG